MGSFHHHNTLQDHDSCKICIVQHNLLSGDNSNETLYLTTLEINSEATISINFQVHKTLNSLQLKARAPPFFS